MLHQQFEESKQQLREIVCVQRETDAAYRALEEAKRELERRVEGTDGSGSGADRAEVSLFMTFI